MANSIPVYTNRTQTATLGAVTDEAPTITLQDGDGAKFPALTTEQYMPAVIVNPVTGVYEEIDITGKTGDVLDVARGKGGTTSQAWGSNATLFVDVPARELDLMRRTLRIASTEDAQVLVDGSPVLTVDGGTGNVGIGVAPASGRRLHVKGASGAFAYIQLEGATGQDALFQLTPGDGTKNWLVQASNSSGDLLLANNSANPAIRIRQTREVGIGVQPTTGNRFQVGTTATSTALTVEDSTGIVRVAHDNINALRIGASGNFRFGYDGIDCYARAFAGVFYISTITASDIIFAVNGLASGRFDQSVNSAFVVGPNAAQSGAKLDIQTTGQAHALVVYDTTGNVGIAASLTIDDQFVLDASANRAAFGTTTAGAAKVLIDQASGTAAIPVLMLDQGDADQEFVDFVGTSAANNTTSVSTWTTGNTIQGFVRVAINGTDYWMPYYNAPTS